MKNKKEHKKCFTEAVSFTKQEEKKNEIKLSLVRCQPESK